MPSRPTFTRRHYRILADALNHASDIRVLDEDVFQEGKRKGVLVAIEFIADALQQDSPKFNRQTFKLASIHR